MTTLTAREIEEIKERLAKATPGPWKRRINYAGEPSAGWVVTHHGTKSGQQKTICFMSDGFGSENHALIAAAPTDIANLLETVEAQQAEIERLRAALEPFKASFKHIMSVERGPTHLNLPLSVTQSMLCIGDLLNAAAALEKKEPDPKTGQVS